MAKILKKHCPFCKNFDTIKWGKQNNKQRWFCKKCSKSFFLRNSGTRDNQKLKLFHKWIIGKRTIPELSKEVNKSTSALRRTFEKFLDHPPAPIIKQNNTCHLIIDGVYFGNTFCLVNYFDNELIGRRLRRQQRISV